MGKRKKPRSSKLFFTTIHPDTGEANCKRWGHPVAFELCITRHFEHREPDCEGCPRGEAPRDDIICRAKQVMDANGTLEGSDTLQGHTDRCHCGVPAEFHVNNGFVCGNVCDIHRLEIRRARGNVQVRPPVIYQLEVQDAKG